jgi:hypothetical protein
VSSFCSSFLRNFSRTFLVLRSSFHIVKILSYSGKLCYHLVCVCVRVCMLLLHFHPAQRFFLLYSCVVFVSFLFFIFYIYIVFLLYILSKSFPTQVSHDFTLSLNSIKPLFWSSTFIGISLLIRYILNWLFATSAFFDVKARPD